MTRTPGNGMLLCSSEPRLHDLAAQLREIERIARVGSWRYNGSDAGFIWSDETFRLLGYEPHAVHPSVLHFLRQIHQEDQSRVIAAVRNAIRQGSSLMLVFRVRGSGDVVRHLRVLGRLAHDVGEMPQWTGTVQDISAAKHAEQERDEMFDQVCAGRERMQALSHRLLQVQEMERRTIARDLHDELGQELTALQMTLDAAAGLTQGHAALKPIFDSIAIVRHLLHHVRDLALDLRPSMLDDLGLEATLEWYLARQAERYGWTAVCRVHAFQARPDEHVEAACFRVAQEALTNVARHAKATHISLTVRQTMTDIFELAISDNGVGFDPAQARLKVHHGQSVGLLGMEERVRFAGGTMAITSHRGYGTTVVARLPITVGTMERRFRPR